MKLKSNILKDAEILLQIFPKSALGKSQNVDDKIFEVSF
jgi:hypothetical protein